MSDMDMGDVFTWLNGPGGNLGPDWGKHRDFRIEIKVEGSREQCLEYLKRKLEWLQQDGCPNIYEAGGGSAGPSHSIYAGPRPLSVEERIAKLEGE